MQIKKVAILGAGAIGGYLIWGLNDKLKDNLCVVAEGDRAERIKTNGIIINEKKYFPVVKSPEQAKGADILFVNVKGTALSDTLDDIKEVVTENTIVVSLLNGVSSEEIIGQKIGMEHMLYSLIRINSERVGNEIKFDGETAPGIYIGEKNIYKPTERVEAVIDLFKDTGVHITFKEDIIKAIWFKFVVNVSQNLPQAIVSVGCGSYEDSEHMKYIVKKLTEEVVAIAKAKGIDISQPDEVEGKSSPAKKTARYSTLQDLDAKRHTEIDMFAGEMVRMSKETGVETPFCDLTYHLIKVLEEKNDGLFDYQ